MACIINVIVPAVVAPVVPKVEITEPADSAMIFGAFTVTATIDVWAVPGTTATATSYIGGVEQESVAMALSVPPGTWSAAMSFPGDGAGSIDVTFNYDGSLYSDSIPVSFVVA